MKRAFPILLAILVAFLGTDSAQILKLPQLVKHFNEHKSQNLELSFSDFLLEHYTDIPHTDNDWEEDMKLPFKKVEHTASIIYFFSSPKIQEKNRPTAYHCKPVSLYRFACNLSDFTHTIWQPPKNA